MINILIAENDDTMKGKIERTLSSSKDDVKIYLVHNFEKGLNIAKEYSIEIFFVDTNFCNNKGVDFAVELRKISKYSLRWIIFISEELDYIMQAFKKLHCYDYIIKPFTDNHVKELEENLINKILKRNIEKRQKMKNIIIDIEGKLIKVYIDEIYFIEINQKVCTLYTKQSIYKSKKLTLRRVMDMIDESYFIQSHKSFAVNIKYIKHIGKISNKLWDVSFQNCDKSALLGAKFYDQVIREFKKC